MLKAIPRYGVRAVPNTDQIVKECRRRAEIVQGPQIRAFENAFARRLGGGYAISASYGRMAFYYILRAFQLPPGSEIIMPALTFWVIPEIARTAGYVPVFADVEPRTFNLDLKSVERAITAKTRAIVPTHLYGMPCHMQAVMAIAERHDLCVIEDCAHALGATYEGRPVGTFGDAAFFSFQTLKPLNTYGGGMAYTRDASLASRIVSIVEGEAWPKQEHVHRRLFLGRLQRWSTHPAVFTATGFPILWFCAFFGWRPDTYLWERIRPLDPLPSSYTERFSNVQAAIGLAGLEHLDEWNSRCQRNAEILTRSLDGIQGVTVPHVPSGRTHVFYQYCVFAPDRERVIHRCIRRGVDVETLHVDVCTRLPLFQHRQWSDGGAVRAAEALQFPVYASLTESQVETIASRIRTILRQRNSHSAEPKAAVY